MIQQQEERTVDYDELVDQIKEVLIERYGSIAEFTRHADFVALGHRLSESDKIQTYFALPKSCKRRIKSAGFMTRLAQEYLGREIQVKTEVRKVQTLLEQ